MIIQHQQPSWELGAVQGSDPNAHSFHSQNWQRHGGKRHSADDEETAQDNVVTIGSHPPYHNNFLSVNLNLGSAISFSQTQDAFLKTVQEELERMDELSALAQNEFESDRDRQSYKAEFATLQKHIREIEEKMIDAISIFEAAALEMTMEAGEFVETEEMTTFGKIPIHDYLENSANPEKTIIKDGKTASDASDTIKSALSAITRLRTQVGNHILELSHTGEQLAAEMEDEGQTLVEIKDGSGAEESTKSVRSNILAKSGVAMMAQANALPGSTLRLLG